jgi:hypothetical protein
MPSYVARCSRLEELLKQQQLAALALTITGYLAFLEDS